MEKTAQKRSILNKLRELTNVSGIAAEKFFNPEFKRVMESLREKDDEIRSLVTGVKIGQGDPGADPVALKDIVKSAKSNLNRREYMLAVSDLGRFHRKLSEISQKITSLNFDIDKVHHQFLFGTEEEPILKDEHKERLQYLKNRFAREQNTLVKQAGIMDFFYNLGRRGRALSAWEKRYPDKAKPLAKGTAAVLDRSVSMLERTLSSLKEMASARSIRNIDAYMKAANDITKHYNKYHTEFETFYKNIVQPLIKDMDFGPPPTLPMETQVSPSAPPVVPVSVGPTGTIPGAPNSKLPAVIPSPAIPSPSLTDPNGPPTLRSIPPMTPPPAAVPAPVIPADPTTLKSSEHAVFLNSLESLSQESPLVLASHITRYARSIQNRDPDTAIGLFKIAKSIKE